MEIIILVLLPLSLLLFVGLGLMVFFKAAFAGPIGVSASDFSQKDLPLLSGDALRQWAGGKARQVVAKYGQLPRRGNTATALAHEIEDLTNRVIENSLPGFSRDQTARCNRASRETISLTTPEALAIVETLRHRLSRRELQQLRNQAAKNTEQLASADQPPEESAAPPCPLFSQNGCCLSFESRPLFCRGRCLSCIENSCGTTVSNEGNNSAFAAEVREGFTDGFAAGLTAAGLDGQRYELNSALVRALDVPDASARWSRGEAVLKSCRALHVVESN